MADATDLRSVVLMGVWVRVPPWAQNKIRLRPFLFGIRVGLERGRGWEGNESAPPV